MARIPVGRQYTASVEGDVVVPMTCAKCDRGGVAVVRAKGEGTASSPLWLRSEGAKADAQAKAQQDIDENAVKLSKLATCPACGHRDEAALRNVLLLAIGKAILAAAVGYLVFRFVGRRAPEGSPLPILAGIGLGLFTAWKESWMWREVGQRVRVPTDEELAQLEKGSSAPSPDA